MAPLIVIGKNAFSHILYMGIWARLKSRFYRKEDDFKGYRDRVAKIVSEKGEQDLGEFLDQSAISEKMELLAEEAKEFYGVDYDQDSLRAIDSKFERLEDDYPNAESINPSNKEELNEVMRDRPEDFEYSRRLGILQNQALAFFGKVIKKEFGGEWMEKNFSDALERSGKIDVTGGLAGISVPLGDEKFHFVNVPNLVNKRVNDEISLHEIYRSVNETIEEKETQISKKDERGDIFDKSDMRDRADNISEGLDLEESFEGLKKLDKVLTIIDYESDVDDIDMFVLEVGCFLGLVLENNLDVEVKNVAGEFVIYVPETSLKMSLMEAADNCVKEQEKSLSETYRFFEQQRSND